MQPVALQLDIGILLVEFKTAGWVLPCLVYINITRSIRVEYDKGMRGGGGGQWVPVDVGWRGSGLLKWPEPQNPNPLSSKINKPDVT